VGEGHTLSVIRLRLISASDWVQLPGDPQTNNKDNKMSKSIIRINAEKDSTYRPYCMRCREFIRMNIVSRFYWKCKCGAEHDERNINEK
jgi:hypothetical protein